ncbi:3-carboxy-cis,cis-muconate cycloisomerase [Nakamurella sp. UYEF19]|uniref:lyase family protein n=1 Tax=Nakamurella sp. UYEF19 TaxID=1756392 RepID=UPI003397EEBB
MTGIFGTTFTRGWDTGLPDDQAWLDALVQVEKALVDAGERAGVIPPFAAHDIRSGWSGASAFGVEQIGEGAGAGGNPVIPLVLALKAAVPEEVQRFVHLGATSQDVLDTAAMLLSRRAIEQIVGHLTRAADAAADLAGSHADTTMAGRTLMQDALPMTFGLRAAGWMQGLDGAADRLRLVAAGLPVQYGGPVGTFSGSLAAGSAIRGALADRLGLADTTLAWHTARLPIGDLAGALGTAAGIVGKVALDVVLMAQTAVGEAAEGSPSGVGHRGADGHGGSSSMSHKHNPISAISARACAQRTPGLVATLYAGMEQEQERAAGAWHSEWETLGDLLRLTGSAAAWLTDSLQHLMIDATEMLRHSAPLPGGPGESRSLVDGALATRSNKRANR